MVGKQHISLRPSIMSLEAKWLSHEAKGTTLLLCDVEKLTHILQK